MENTNEDLDSLLEEEKQTIAEMTGSLTHRSKGAYLDSVALAHTMQIVKPRELNAKKQLEAEPDGEKRNTNLSVSYRQFDGRYRGVNSIF